MKRFTQLYFRLASTTRTSDKLRALEDYFRSAPPADAAWAVYLLSGRRLKRAVVTPSLRQWVAEDSGYPLWLVDECYHLVGDLSETLSLLLPSEPVVADPPSLDEMIRKYILPLMDMPRAQHGPVVREAWSLLNTDQRLVFHKLLGGEFRVGVSRDLMIRALANVAGVEPARIAHRLAGAWQPSAEAMTRLLSGAEADGHNDPALPYPFMLAHPLQEPPESLGDISDWRLEWKWDGIRAQIIRRAGQCLIWSRGDEKVDGTFPELVQASASLPDGTVLDGEIVAWDEAARRPFPFTRLQRRLNRQQVHLSFWPEVPLAYIAFDLLERDGQDLRSEPLRQRRAALEEILAGLPPDSPLRLDYFPPCPSWDDLRSAVNESRQRAVEGVMLKRLDSVYQPGRPTGPWWKWKVDPYTVDAVLIAAEPGHGRRAGLLTDYTFGVWSDGNLVPMAKAYSGLTDEEIRQVDRFARKHTTARHGPVHAVEPLMVFELGFEAIQKSTRHKSGVALRFPRILRIRTDKTPAEADQLQTLRDLLRRCEEGA